ncbi:MAG: hypothetical protein JWM16_1885 [Verrucomicrobiales bacterium]|nr:hypothetical protein [Verrucomicrobiales bacterium]
MPVDEDVPHLRGIVLAPWFWNCITRGARGAQEAHGAPGAQEEDRMLDKIRKLCLVRQKANKAQEGNVTTDKQDDVVRKKEGTEGSVGISERGV